MSKSDIMLDFLNSGMTPEQYMQIIEDAKKKREKLKNPSTWQKIVQSLMMIIKIFGRKTNSTRPPLETLPKPVINSELK